MRQLKRTAGTNQALCFVFGTIFGSQTILCQTNISLSPSSADASTYAAANAPNNLTIDIKGSGLNKNPQIWMNCATPLKLGVDKKTKLPDVTLTKEQLSYAQVITITATAAQEPCTLTTSNTAFFVVTGPYNGISQTTPLGQSLIGLDVTAASSTNPQAVFLGSAMLDVPFESRTDIATVNWWAGGELKIAGMGQPGSVANLSSAAAFAGYLASADNATPDKIVQSVELSGDITWKIASGWRIHTGTFDSGTRPSNPLTLLTVSLIAKGGAITPLSASQSSPPVYLATAQILALPTHPTPPYASSCTIAQGAVPTCYVTFIPVDRSHFYRNYEGGLRLKIYGEDNADHILRFPGILDLTVGQNEYVTGGKFHGAVLEIGGTFPIPVLDGFYGFGGMDLALSNAGNSGAQLLLIPAPATANLTFTSPSVYTLPSAQPNRDRYSFGFGIDFIHLYEAVKNKPK